MADQVVLLNHGRIEQIGTPREIYAKPASVFAARFIGTPPMSIISLAGSAISGSTQTVSAPEAAVSIGLRPEEVALDGDVAANRPRERVSGADCLLRCRIGDQETLYGHQARTDLTPGRKCGSAGLSAPYTHLTRRA